MADTGKRLATCSKVLRCFYLLFKKKKKKEEKTLKNYLGAAWGGSYLSYFPIRWAITGCVHQIGFQGHSMPR